MEWISVNDMLPNSVLDMKNKKQIKVLVCLNNGTIRTALFGMEKDWKGDFSGWGFIRGCSNVTHWMPLPEPPVKT